MDLHDLKLSSQAKYNILWDRKAEQAWLKGTSQPDADILPSEKRALFVTELMYKKITGALDESILQQLYTEKLQAYIETIHGMTIAKLNETNQDGLPFYLK